MITGEINDYREATGLYQYGDAIIISKYVNEL